MQKQTPKGLDERAFRVAKRIHEEERPLATVLYGSRATGDHREDSDIDILMITENPQRVESQLEKRAEQLVLEEYGKPVEVQIKMAEDEDALEDERLADSITGQALMKGIVISDWPRVYQSRYGGDEPAPPRFCWHQYKAQNYFAKDFLESLERTADRHGSGPQSENEDSPAIKAKEEEQEDRQKQDIWQRGGEGIHHALRATVEAHGERTRDTDSLTELRRKLEYLAPDEGIPTSISIEEYESGTIPQTMASTEMADAISGDIRKLRATATKLMRRVKTVQKKNIDQSRESRENLDRVVRSGIRSMAKSVLENPEGEDEPGTWVTTNVDKEGKMTLEVSFGHNPRATHWKARENEAAANPGARTTELRVIPNWTATAGYSDPETGETVTIDLDEQEQRAVNEYASREADRYMRDETFWDDDQDDGTDDDTEYVVVEGLAQQSQEDLEGMIEEFQEEIALFKKALERKREHTENR